MSDVTAPAPSSHRMEDGTPLSLIEDCMELTQGWSPEPSTLNVLLIVLILTRF